MKKISLFIAEIEDLLVDIMILFNKKFKSMNHVDLSPNQRIVLMLISKHERLTVGEIAAKINVSSSAVSQMVTKLEQMKFIKRVPVPTDRRSLVIKLDEKGAEFLSNMENVRKELTDKFLTKMEIEEIELLSEKMKKFRNILFEDEGENTADETH